MRESRHRALLTAAAAAPFVPAALQFLRRGVPDYLFTGDGATIELRVLHAAHGAQLTGPYSRFVWSHPGPTFFYLALPLYEALHQRGPALNLFMFLVNLACAVAIVLLARRLRGGAFAWLTAALLAVFELVALPFVQTGEWNPVAPILPFVLLSMVAARLSQGAVTLVPAFAFVASAIVQTHLAYAPEVAALSVFALAANLWRISGSRNHPLDLNRQARWILNSTVGVLALCWALPAYEAATRHPGNLQQLLDFFSKPHPPEHPWEAVFTTLFDQLSSVPVALVRTLHISIPPPGPLVGEAITIAELALVVAALAVAVRRKDAVLGTIAGITLLEIAAAAAAIRAIRGEILPYLVFWVTVPGLLSALTCAAWLSTRGARTTWAAAGAIAIIALTLSAPVPRAPVFRDEELAATQLAHAVEQYVTASALDRPVVRVASSDVWPSAAAVVLHLRKRNIPFFVEPSWAFMFGEPLADPGGEHGRLLVGDGAFDQHARTEPQLSHVVSVGGVSVYAEPAGYFGNHRIKTPPEVLSAFGVDRDPHLAADGVIPPDGTLWDSPASVIMTASASALTVRVPRDEDVMGLFASVDGNDLYAVRCAARNLSWTLGVAHPAEGIIGMQTRLLFADALGTCESITIAPVSGDGFYSLGEIGFLRR